VLEKDCRQITPWSATEVLGAELDLLQSLQQNQVRRLIMQLVGRHLVRIVRRGVAITCQSAATRLVSSQEQIVMSTGH